MVLLYNNRHLHKTNLGNSEKIQAVRNHYKKHNNQVVPSKKGTKGTTNKLERYRVPENLILDLFAEIIISD